MHHRHVLASSVAPSRSISSRSDTSLTAHPHRGSGVQGKPNPSTRELPTELRRPALGVFRNQPRDDLWQSSRSQSEDRYASNAAAHAHSLLTVLGVGLSGAATASARPQGAAIDRALRSGGFYTGRLPTLEQTAPAAAERPVSGKTGAALGRVGPRCCRASACARLAGVPVRHVRRGFRASARARPDPLSAGDRGPRRRGRRSCHGQSIAPGAADGRPFRWAGPCWHRSVTALGLVETASIRASICSRRPERM